VGKKGQNDSKENAPSQIGKCVEKGKKNGGEKGEFKTNGKHTLAGEGSSIVSIKKKLKKEIQKENGGKTSTGNPLGTRRGNPCTTHFCGRRGVGGTKKKANISNQVGKHWRGRGGRENVGSRSEKKKKKKGTKTMHRKKKFHTSTKKGNWGMAVITNISTVGWGGGVGSLWGSTGNGTDAHANPIKRN